MAKGLNYEFYLTGNYSINENGYEKIFYERYQVLNESNSLIDICQNTIIKEQNILHNGI